MAGKTKTKTLNILFSTSEAVPFAKEGGLGDVAGTLPRELVAMGHDVRIVMPLYKRIDRAAHGLRDLHLPLKVPMGVIGDLFCGVHDAILPGTKVKVYFLEHDQFFGSKDGLYNDWTGEGYLDNDNRFVFLCRASLELCKVLDFKPDVVHVNDWQTAAVPVLINTAYRNDPLLRDVASILTIHNMQYQGQYYKGLMDVLGIRWEHFNYLELERYDQVNLLKGALYHATIVTTVSPTYAQEIMTPVFGFGLEEVVRDRAADLYGVLNGVDYDEWNPESDRFIAAHYSAKDLSGKATCKADLQRRFGLQLKPDVPLVGMVSRLVWQKGIDVLAEAIQRILSYDLQFVLLGAGEMWAHLFFSSLAAQHRGKVGCHIGYSDELAHRIEAGSDFFLMPSRFEPCGLNQMYSLRYGTLPIVRATGGLNDTVESFNELTLEGTGFKFYELTADSITNTVGWAIHTYLNRKDAMELMIRDAMGRRFTWKESAKEYERLYYQAIRKRLGDEEFGLRYGNP